MKPLEYSDAYQIQKAINAVLEAVGCLDGIDAAHVAQLDLAETVEALSAGLYQAIGAKKEEG